tara:strand:- start:705 stop:1196 length:492 start_codon:yes stop_codon:yes gene_type:complete
MDTSSTKGVGRPKSALSTSVAITGGFDHTEDLEEDVEVTQTPKMFKGTLKEYQLRGLRWLVNVYNNGINGILADEMGLGKTIQSMAILAYLAETKGIWGPFLVICPTSTLPNWKNEIEKFVPQFKVLPYWGSQVRHRLHLANSLLSNISHICVLHCSCSIMLT